MTGDAGDLDAWHRARRFVQPLGAGDWDAELVVLEPGGNVRVRLRVHVRVDAHGDGRFLCVQLAVPEFEVVHYCFFFSCVSSGAGGRAGAAGAGFDSFFSGNTSGPTWPQADSRSARTTRRRIAHLTGVRCAHSKAP